MFSFQNPQWHHPCIDFLFSFLTFVKMPYKLQQGNSRCLSVPFSPLYFLSSSLVSYFFPSFILSFPTLLVPSSPRPFIFLSSHGYLPLSLLAPSFPCFLIFWFLPPPFPLPSSYHPAVLLLPPWLSLPSPPCSSFSLLYSYLPLFVFLSCLPSPNPLSVPALVCSSFHTDKK